MCMESGLSEVGRAFLLFSFRARAHGQNCEPCCCQSLDPFPECYLLILCVVSSVGYRVWCLCVVEYSCEVWVGALHESEEWSSQAQHLLLYSQGCRVLVLFQRLLGCAVGFG